MRTFRDWTDWDLEEREREGREAISDSVSAFGVGRSALQISPKTEVG